MGLTCFRACDIRGKRDDGKTVIPRIENNDTLIAKIIDKTDGISIKFPDWRFDSCSPNTGPLVRFSVESRVDAPLVHGLPGKTSDSRRGPD